MSIDESENDDGCHKDERENDDDSGNDEGENDDDDDLSTLFRSSFIIKMLFLCVRTLGCFVVERRAARH